MSVDKVVENYDAEHGQLTVRVAHDGEPRIFYDGWELTLTRGKYDGVPVLFIDTSEDSPTACNEHGPRCRILLNDDPLWANPPYSQPEDESLLAPEDRTVESENDPCIFTT